MKHSEAKILIYLSEVHSMYKWTRAISFKLSMDYGYLTRILADMQDKGWVKAVRRENKKFYELLKAANLKRAKKILAK